MPRPDIEMESSEALSPAGVPAPGVERGGRPWFLGVDVAGAGNTWAAALVPNGVGAEIVWGPRRTTLAEIVAIADAEDIAAVAIDAQLTTAVSDERGFRSADRILREMLPVGYRDWVASVNSLMAVPVRGQMLAEALGPTVGTILETHPRASLHFALSDRADPDVQRYKRGPGAPEATGRLSLGWAGRFGITGAVEQLTDGGLDALVCATVALLYHRAPERLMRLPHRAADRRGRGPFIVVAPEAAGPAAGATLEAAAALEEPTAMALPVAVTGSPEISAGTDLVYSDAVGRALMCPACGVHEFTRWPYGWDAHVAHACRGITGHDLVERKAAFKTRFRPLFRP